MPKPEFNFHFYDTVRLYSGSTDMLVVRSWFDDEAVEQVRCWVRWTAPYTRFETFPALCLQKID